MASITYENGYCEKCQQYQKLVVTKPNHILHLILTIVTGGFWIIIWVLMRSKRFCDVCGTRMPNSLLSTLIRWILVILLLIFSIFLILGILGILIDSSSDVMHLI